MLRAAVPVEAEPDTAGWAAARWALAHGRATGHGTDTLPAGTPWQFRPIGRPDSVLGILGLRLGGEDQRLDPDTDRAIGALLDQAGVALERMRLIEDAAHSSARAETETLRTALLTSLSHDLRTPLTSIRGAIETLQAAGASMPAARRNDLLQTAAEESARLARYLGNILDIVRIEHGQITPKREPVDIADAIETAALRAERSSRRTIRRAPGAPLPSPNLDPALLDQVLANLLDNALKFSGPQGKVAIRAEPDRGGVAIIVEDDGPGIPRPDLERVFDPFFRTTRADSGTGGGTGLGLAICRGLAHAMGGRIHADSPVTPGGNGTRMTLRFPA